MQLKDLISRGDLQIKTKIKSEGERFIVGFKLDLSREEMAMLGLGVPRKGRGKEVAKQPTWKQAFDTLKDSVESLRELVIKGFEQVNKRLDRVEERLDHIEKRLDTLENLPTIKRELHKLN